MASSKAVRLPAPPQLRVGVSAVAVLFIAPFLYLLVRNLGNTDGFFSAVLTRQALAALGRSVALGLCVSVAAAVIGTACAWTVSRSRIPGRRLWRILLPLPLVVPSFVGAFVFVAAFSRGGLFESALGPFGVDQISTVRGFTGSFIVLTLFTYPYVYLPVVARLSHLSPAFEESARLLGARPLKAFGTVVLPQLKPAVLSGGLFVFLYSISDFGVVQLMRYETLTRSIYANRIFNRELSLALSLELAVIAVAVVLFERSISRRVSQAPPALSGPPLRMELGRWKIPAMALVVLTVAFSIGVPLLVLFFWMSRGVSSGAGFALVEGGGSLLGPLLASTAAGIGAAFVVLALTLPVAYLTERFRSRIGRPSDTLIVAGFAVPGLALALSLVYATVNSGGLLTPLYQTFPLLIAAYVLHFGAHGLRASQVALGALPQRVDDAAKMLGARRLQRLLRIDLPVMRPDLLAGGGLVLLSVMKELPASLLLAPAGFQTLAMKIWSATESAYFADAAVFSLALLVLSGALTWVLVIRRGEVRT